jgi:hypothetical protein
MTIPGWIKITSYPLLRLPVYSEIENGASEIEIFVNTDEIVTKYLHVDAIECVSELEQKVCETLGLEKEDNCIIQTVKDEIIYCCEPLQLIMKRISEASSI